MTEEVVEEEGTVEAETGVDIEEDMAAMVEEEGTTSLHQTTSHTKLINVSSLCF